MISLIERKKELAKYIQILKDCIKSFKDEINTLVDRLNNRRNLAELERNEAYQTILYLENKIDKENERLQKMKDEYQQILQNIEFASFEDIDNINERYNI